MNRAALFCDETIDYRIPAEPDCGDIVTLKFRTAKDDADYVCLVICGLNVRIGMKRVASQGMFDYYECKLPVKEEVLYFYFEITKNGQVCKYNRLGVSEDMALRRMFPDHSWFPCAGLDQGCCHVPDLCGPFLQR